MYSLSGSCRFYGMPEQLGNVTQSVQFGAVHIEAATVAGRHGTLGILPAKNKIFKRIVKIEASIWNLLEPLHNVIGVAAMATRLAPGEPLGKRFHLPAALQIR